MLSVLQREAGLARVAVGAEELPPLTIPTPSDSTQTPSTALQSACVPVVTQLAHSVPYGRGLALDVHLEPGVAWVATTIGVERVDVSAPDQPTGAGWIDLPGVVETIGAIDGDIVAATSLGVLHLLDPADASVLSSLPLPGPARDLAVSGDLIGAAPDGRTSVVLEVDGMLREKRPYSGDRVAFAPLAQGDCRITLLRQTDLS